MYDPKAKDIKIYIADCNNHCVRTVHYDQGDTRTCEFKGIPQAVQYDKLGAAIATNSQADDGETAEGTTNKSGLLDGEDVMGLECDGQ